MTEFKTTQKHFDQIYDDIEKLETIDLETKNTAIQMVKQMIEDVEKVQSKLKEKTPE